LVAMRSSRRLRASRTYKIETLVTNSGWRFTTSTHFVSAGFGLVVQHLSTCLLSLLLVNVFHQDALVLEHVTFHLHVQVVVQMTIDLLSFTVFFEQATEDTHAGHPQEFDRHTSVSGTAALSIAAVTSLPAGDGVLANTETRVHNNGFLDDQTVLDELADVLA
jgi:hypothetical protein